jgi:hypothetical protein
MISSRLHSTRRLARATGVAGVVALALPFAAQAATSHAVVVSVNPGSHTVALVSAQKTVKTFSYSHSVSGLATGSELSYQAKGDTLKSGKVTGTASSFTFDGVVSSLKGNSVELSLPGAKHLTVSAASVAGIVDGDTVAATETRAGKGWSVSLKVLKSVGKKSPLPSTAKTSSAATVVSIGQSSLGLLLANGQTITAAVPASGITYFTSNSVMRLCETADVVYQTGGATGAVLDALVPTGISTSPALSLGSAGNCSSDSDGESDVIGTITSLSATVVNVTSLFGQSYSFPLAAGRDLQADENVGDLADVTFNPANDVAYNLESSELYMTGVVTSVAPETMTITNSVTGASTVLPAAAAAYINIVKGDTVGVDYWIDGGKPRADNVGDLSSGVSN